MSDIILAIQYAKNRNVNIINISWCTDIDDEKLFEIIKENNTILFICASGNTFEDVSLSKVFPAAYNLDNIIAVSAINSSGCLYRNSGFELRVDIAAPGENLLCILPNNDVFFNSGTSLACAYVTGASALLWSNFPNLTPKEILKESSKKLPNLD